MQQRKQLVLPKITKTTENPLVEHLSTIKTWAQRNIILHDIVNMLNEDKNREIDNLK